MKYIDCNESSWQVILRVHGERHYMSARTAAVITYGEKDEERAKRQSPINEG